ncbi:MAG: SIR2 family NAD-dependent protein deacylase [Actinomycetota bacterium]
MGERTLDHTLQEAAGFLSAARSVTVLTGAGISTESGIPDFRGPQGVWTSDPMAERLSHIRYYMQDPDVRVAAWRSRLAHPAWTARPNDGHRALARLESRGKVHTLVTQNIDGLHQAAGTSADILIEIHGTIHDVLCMGCGERAPMQRALDRVRAGEPDPPCRTCGGILKSATVSFGQPLVEEDLLRAQVASETCDLFMAIGTTLGVYPVAYLPRRALDSGARLVIFNSQETAYDGQAHAVVRAPLGEALPALAELVDG